MTGAYPHTVYHDNGREFDNKIYQKYLRSKHIRQRMTEPHQPASTIERFNGSLRSAVDRFLHMYKSRRYLDYLPRYTTTYNSHTHRMTGQSPKNLLTKPELWKAAVKR